MSKNKSLLKRLLDVAGATDLNLHRASTGIIKPNIFASLDIPGMSYSPWLTTSERFTAPFYLPFAISWELLEKENISMQSIKGLKYGYNTIDVLSKSKMFQRHILLQILDAANGQAVVWRASSDEKTFIPTAKSLEEVKIWLDLHESILEKPRMI